MPARLAFISIISVVILLVGCDGPVSEGNPDRGKAAIRAFGCGACHEIAGIRGAVGRVGPPLIAIGRQAYIAGILPNTPTNLRAWMQNPPAIAPNTAMPNLGITPDQARDIAAYLYTLRGSWP